MGLVRLSRLLFVQTAVDLNSLPLVLPSAERRKLLASRALDPTAWSSRLTTTDQLFQSLEIAHAQANSAAAVAILLENSEVMAGLDAGVQIALLKDALRTATTERAAATAERDAALLRVQKLKADISKSEKVS